MARVAQDLLAITVCTSLQALLDYSSCRTTTRFLQQPHPSALTIGPWIGVGWGLGQTLTEALLSSATNVIARLPALEEEEHFRWALEDLPHVVRAVRAKQMLALEATLQRLRDTVRGSEQ